MNSLAQKRFFAKRDGKDEVVLTMEEAEAVLEQIAELDRKLGEYSEYLPESVIRAECEEMFGPRPADSLKRCVFCDEPLPEVPVMPGDECCDSYTGSFYWKDTCDDV